MWGAFSFFPSLSHNTGNLEPHGLSSHPDSITQYPVWTWRSITTTSCLNFHSDKTAIRDSLWGFNKIMPCQAYWHDRHSVNMSCASATERIWHQSGGDPQCSPEQSELHWRSRSMPLGPLKQRSYPVQPGIMQINLGPALGRMHKDLWLFTKCLHWWGKGLELG